MDRMNPLDALFLLAEDGVSHMHIGSCAVFDGDPPSVETCRALVASKLHLVPRFRQRAVRVPLDLGLPVWVDDPTIDLEFHVRTGSLPPGSGRADLHAFVGDLMSTELDRSRPLWEMWIVDGLDPVAVGGRWAVVSKVHHCMVDGVSGTDLMASVLDVHRSTTVAEPEPWTPARAPGPIGLAVGAATDALGNQMRAGRAAVASLAHPGSVLRHGAQVAAGLVGFARDLVDVDPARSSRSSITGSIGPARSYAVARARLDDVRRIRSVLGGSVNDVVLAATTAGFRALLASRGDAVDRTTLRSLVPVSIRAADDRRHDNQVSMLIADLPVEAADPVERLRRVRCELDRLKAGHEADAGATAFELAGHLPAPLYARAIASTMAWLRGHPQYTINTVTTNVPGPGFPLFLLGRRMLEYAPYVPLSAGLRIGVAILSYDGSVRFGLTGDRGTTTDLTVMADAIEREFDDLLAECDRVSRAGRAVRRSAA